MGVTTHWFAFDPSACPAPPTVDALLAAGLISEALAVPESAEGCIAAVPSWLEDNQRWWRNIDGEWAWTRAREALEPAERAPFDRWFGHLFWDPEGGGGCGCGSAPEGIADDTVVYSPELLTHLLQLARPLEPALHAVGEVFADGAPAFASYPWMYTPDGFAALVDGWQATLRAAARYPGWSLLRWVWI